MVKSRASVFDDTPEIDLSAFAPKPRSKPDAPRPEKVRAVLKLQTSAAVRPYNRRRYRRLQKTANPALPHRPQCPAQYQGVTANRRRVLCHHRRTCRRGWSLGYTFEQAIAALKRELETKRELEKLS